MTAMNFPAGANEGQEYAAPNGTTYVFDGEKWNVKSASLSAVATSGSYSDLTDTPEEYKFNIGADDSTEREVRAGETITIKGGANVTTSSDAEGNITVSAEDAITEGQTYTIDIIGNVFGEDSQKIIDRETGEINGTVNGELKGSVFADDSQQVIDGTTGTVTAPVVGDLTGSVFADNSTLIVDAVNNAVTADTLTANDKNVYYGDVARTRVANATSSGLNAFDIHLFRISEYRSMKIIYQVTNETDSEYYVTELLCMHDGTDAYNVEYATIFTSTNPDVEVVSVINNGNYVLRVTPQVNVTLKHKMIINTMTV